MLHPCLGVTMKIETIDQAISALNECKDERQCEWAIHNLASFFRIYAQTGNAVLTDLFTALLKHLKPDDLSGDDIRQMLLLCAASPVRQEVSS